MKTHELFVVLLLCVSMVGAENVTIAKTGNVSISCNNVSQCVIYQSSGNPVFFVAVDANVTVPVSVSFTYPANETVLINNYTIVTQNVSIENCSTPPIVDEAIIRDGLIAALQPAVDSSCKAACDSAATSVNECQNKLQSSVESEKNAIIELERSRAEYTSLQGMSESRMQVLNATLSSQIDVEKSSKYPWIILSILCLTICGMVIGLIYYKSRTLNANKGTKGLPPLPELDE